MGDRPLKWDILYTNFSKKFMYICAYDIDIVVSTICNTKFLKYVECIYCSNVLHIMIHFYKINVCIR